MKITKALALVLSALPCACHVTTTGPLLWSDHSQQALITMLAFWVVDIGIILLVVCLTTDILKNKFKEIIWK